MQVLLKFGKIQDDLMLAIVFPHETGKHEKQAKLMPDLL